MEKQFKIQNPQLGLVCFASCRAAAPAGRANARRALPLRAEARFILVPRSLRSRWDAPSAAHGCVLRLLFLSFNCHPGRSVAQTRDPVGMSGA